MTSNAVASSAHCDNTGPIAKTDEKKKITLIRAPRTDATSLQKEKPKQKSGRSKTTAHIIHVPQECLRLSWMSQELRKTQNAFVLFALEVAFS